MGFPRGISFSAENCGNGRKQKFKAVLSSRIEPDPNWVHVGALDDKSFVRSLVAGLPDAFICANDHTAALLLRALRRCEKLTCSKPAQRIELDVRAFLGGRAFDRGKPER
jgi:hypothetical protein